MNQIDTYNEDPGTIETATQTDASSSGTDLSKDTALGFVYGASAIMLLVFMMCLIKHRWTTAGKIVAFTVLTVAVLFSTAGLIGTTISNNLSSPTGGPVHWHADYLVNICGKHIELIDPMGLRNKVGTPVLHEHDDDRIHLEGTPGSMSEATLGYYFETVGGNLRADHFSMPTPDGMIEVKNDDDCNGRPGTLRVFVESQGATEDTKDRIWHLESDPEHYRYGPYINVPPGDRVYISFDAASETEILRDAKTAAENGFKDIDSMTDTH